MPVGVIAGLSSAILTAVITELYCDRCLAHRAFGVHPALASLLDTYFRVIVGTDPESWAAAHRLHHRNADTPPPAPACSTPCGLFSGSSPACDSSS